MSKKIVRDIFLKLQVFQTYDTEERILKIGYFDSYEETARFSFREVLSKAYAKGISLKKNEAKKILLQLLKDKNAIIRFHTAAMFGTSDFDVPEAYPLLSVIYSNDESLSVRAMAAYSLFRKKELDKKKAIPIIKKAIEKEMNFIWQRILMRYLAKVEGNTKGEGIKLLEMLEKEGKLQEWEIEFTNDEKSIIEFSERISMINTDIYYLRKSIQEDKKTIERDSKLKNIESIEEKLEKLKHQVLDKMLKGEKPTTDREYFETMAKIIRQEGWLKRNLIPLIGSVATILAVILSAIFS